MAATTWAQLVANPTREVNILLEVTAGMVLKGIQSWSAFTSTIYYTVIPQNLAAHNIINIAAVKAITYTAAGATNPQISLTSKLSVGGMTVNSFYWEASTNRLYVWTALNASPVGAFLTVTFPLYFSGGNPGWSRTQASPVFNGNFYRPCIAADGIPRISNKVSDSLYGIASSGTAKVGLLNDDGAFDALSSRYLWEGNPAKVLIGGDDLPYSEYKTIFNGRVKGVDWDESRFVLTLTDPIEDLLLNTPVRPLTVADMTKRYNFNYRIRVIPVVVGTVASQQCTTESLVPSYSVHFDTLVPVQMAPTDINPQSATSGPIGTGAQRIYGTAYGVVPIDLASTDTQSIRMLSDGPIHRVLGVRNNQGSLVWAPSGGASSPQGLGDSIYIDMLNGVVYENYSIRGGLILPASGRPYSYDVEGYSNADGTLMDNPADVIQDLMVNRSSVSVAFDSTALSIAQAETSLFSMGYVLTDSTTNLKSYLQKILQVINGFVFVNSSGTYSLVVWTPAMQAPTQSQTSVQLVETTGDFMGRPQDLKSSTTMQQFYTTVQVGFSQPSAYSTGQPIYGTSGLLPEALAYCPVPATLTLDGVLADIGSATIAAKRLARCRQRPQKSMTVPTTLKLIQSNLFQVVQLTKARLPIDSLPSYFGRLLGIAFDASKFQQTLTLDDMRSMLNFPSLGFLAANDSAGSFDSASLATRLQTGFWASDAGMVSGTTSAGFRGSLWF